MNRKILRGTLLAVATAAVLALPAGSLYYEYNAGASCARCHEIRKNYDAWHASSHRDVTCGACHGEITTLDAGFHLGNLRRLVQHVRQGFRDPVRLGTRDIPRLMRSEEHTSELQSPCNLVCRLLFEKKKKITTQTKHNTHQTLLLRDARVELIT